MTVRYTYQDLLSLHEGHDRHEIVDGELFLTPTPRFRQQVVAANLPVLLQPHAVEVDLVPGGHANAPFGKPFSGHAPVPTPFPSPRSGS